VDKRFPREGRLAGLLFVLILSIVFVVLALSPDPGFNLRAIFSYWNTILALGWTYLRFVIPMVTFFSFLLLHVIVTIVLFFDNIASAHTAFPKDKIQQLAIDEIQESDKKRAGWRLIDLDKSELETLKDWAAENREGSDKRLLPTAMILAFVALFANTNWFNETLDGIIGFVNKVLFSSPDSGQKVEFWNIVGVTLLFMMVFSVVRALSSLFSNLVVQNIIVEACIVAGYAVDVEKEKTVETPVINTQSFWERLWKGLGGR